MRLGFSRKECDVLNNEKEIIYFSDYVKSRGINYMAAGVAALGFLFFMINPNITSIIANFVSVDNLPKASYYGNICIVWLEFIAYAVYATYGFNKCTFREHEYLYCMKAGTTTERAKRVLTALKILYTIHFLGGIGIIASNKMFYESDGKFSISYEFNANKWINVVACIIVVVNLTVVYVLCKLKSIKKEY